MIRYKVDVPVDRKYSSRAGFVMASFDSMIYFMLVATPRMKGKSNRNFFYLKVHAILAPAPF